MRAWYGVAFLYLPGVGHFIVDAFVIRQSQCWAGFDFSQVW